MTKIIQLQENDEGVYLKTHAEAVDGLIDKIYPIGSIYSSVSSTNPELLFGGTWERFAKGQVLVGVDETDDDFAAGTTGGEKSHKLIVEEMPKHKFSFSGTTGGANILGGVNNGDVKLQGAASGWGFKSSPHTHSFSGQTNELGGDKPHNNLQPYIAVYMWKRIA